MPQAADVDLVTEFLGGLGSHRARIQLSSSKALRDLSARRPELVYPYLEVFAGLLGHANNILKWNATLTLANLAGVDREGKLDAMIDVYLAPIRGPVMITAANAIKGGALIALAKPHLAARIARHILRVEKGAYATAECRNVAIGHALQALGAFAGLMADARKVREFARRQVSNPRRATANKALRLAASLQQRE